MKKFLIASLVLALSLGVGSLGVAGPPTCIDENGDSNGDNALDLSDAIYLLGHLFQGGLAPVLFCDPVGQKEEDCAVENGDSNGDNALDLSDAVYLLGHLFQGGLAPVPKCEGTLTTEICDSTMDDDMDGLTDCDDPDCIGDSSCPSASLLPATGHTVCYDPGDAPIENDVIDCTDDTIDCFGQDGFHLAGCPSDENRFTPSGDGTVTDNCTGLMWEESAGNGGTALSWCNALAYSDGLPLATHTDWRLPNVLELESIIDYGRTNPTFDDSVFSGPADFYWSSTTVTSNTDSAFFVDFEFGKISQPSNDGTNPDQSKDQSNFVRAVRTVVPAPADAAPLPDTGQTKCYNEAGLEIDDCMDATCPGQDGDHSTGCLNDASRFFVPDPPDGTVTDTCTGLMWQEGTADAAHRPGNTPGVDLNDMFGWCGTGGALAYCETLVLTTDNVFKTEDQAALDGDDIKYRDWRLPNIRELYSISDHTSTQNSPLNMFLGDGSEQSSEHWSSTLRGADFPGDPDPVPSSGHAWTVAFHEGRTTFRLGRGSLHFVIAVRSLP